MKSKRRETDTAGLAFLDVISCGFGAIILLLVLTKVFDPVDIDLNLEELKNYLATLEAEVVDIRGETRILNRDMVRREDQQTDQLEQLTELESRLAALKSSVDNSSDKTKVNNAIKGKLASAKQSLTAEMQRLLSEFQKDLDDDTIGGIPVDSEYVIFIIDTSGSMRQFAWPLLLQKVDETLAVHPKLKGIQVMNDMGNFMFSQYTNQWIPDTQARRRAIMDRLRNWETFSNSSPVEGITKAITTFYRPDRKISLYVLGDDFKGRSIQRVVDRVDQINREGADGKRLVRIHAIGFPVIFTQPLQAQGSVIKFSSLMRELCARNGGTFVALNDYRRL